MKRYLLILILLLAAVLRLTALSRYPVGFNADEAALGYNAYSLLTTGRDEHGHLWPINLESFGDFKPALYAYLLIPFIKVFGLSEFAVRLPSALAGIFSVWLIYLLTKELFTSPSSPPPESGGGWGVVQKIPVIAAFMLAISPWHLHFSRGAWEVNLATTFILSGVYFFILYQKNHTFLNFEFCVLSFALSMYTYQSTRIIAPLLGLGLALMYFKSLIRYPKQLLLAFLTLVFILSPLMLSIIRSDASSRLSGVGLLADDGPVNRVNQLRGQHSALNSLLSRELHNRPVIYTIQFMKNYLDHFNGDFLFITGDLIPRNRIPETGLLYLTDFLLLVLGVFYLFRRSRPHTRIIWLWLAVAPVASALTFQTPHALRAQNLVIPLTIISTAGIYFIISKARYSKALLLLLFTIYTFQFTRYLHQYYIHYPQTYPYAWEYGFKELVSYVESVKDGYDQILVTDKYDQPYILFLWYSRYPPARFQGTHQLTIRDKFNFSTVRAYDKYKFTDTSWDKVRDIHGTLIVAAPDDIPEVGVHVVKTIYFPGGSPAFKIVSN